MKTPKQAGLTGREAVVGFCSHLLDDAQLALRPVTRLEDLTTPGRLRIGTI